MSRSRLALALALAWACLIFVASSIPAPNVPDVSVLRHDKLMHFAAYAPFGAFCLLAVRASSVRLPPFAVILLAGAIAGIYGVSDEFHQHFVPGRSVDAYDVFADWVGGSAGAAIALAIIKHRAARHPAQPVSEQG